MYRNMKGNGHPRKQTHTIKLINTCHQIDGYVPQSQLPLKHSITDLGLKDEAHTHIPNPLQNQSPIDSAFTFLSGEWFAERQGFFCALCNGAVWVSGYYVWLVLAISMLIKLCTRHSNNCLIEIFFEKKNWNCAVVIARFPQMIIRVQWTLYTERIQQ